MKRHLLIVGAIGALLAAGCGRDSTGELPTASAEVTEQIQIESTDVVVEPTSTPGATVTPQPTAAATPTPEATLTPVVTEPVASATPTQEPTPESPTPTAAVTVTASPAPPELPTTPPSQVSAGQPVELTRIEDKNPGPPFSVVVSTIRIMDDGYYRLTGRIRNDGSQVYGGAGVIVTFFTEGGSPSGYSLGKVYGACQLLAPGAECPFIGEIYPRNYVSYHLHPDGTPVEYRRPAPLVLTNVRVEDGWVGYVRITGAATNENSFPVRDAAIAGVLTDAAGQIVGVGSAIVPGEMAPGTSVSFGLYIEQVPYAHYELEAQAIQD